MRKKRFVSILLLGVACVLPILCILMIHHLSLCETLEKMEKGNFGERSYLASMTINTMETRFALYGNFVKEHISCGIYLDDRGSTENTIRYMAFTEDYVNLPMKNGRFFEKDDFTKNNKVAVVGKNVENVHEREGKQYIQVNNQEYYVLGEMGYEEDTAFDNYIFLNLFACDNQELKIYKIDLFSDIDENETMDKCVGVMQNLNSNVEVLAETDNFADTVTVNFNLISYFLGLLLCYILCIILISYQWLMLQRRELSIRRLVGASQGQIVRYIMVQYIIYMLISFVAGYLYCRFIYPSYRSSFYMGYMISAGILFLFMLAAIGKLKNDSIEEAIKK